MKTSEERREFENEFNDFINDVIQDYTHLSENYLKLANIYEGTSKDPVLGFPPNSDELYPYLYDLFSIKSVSKEGINDKIQLKMLMIYILL